MVKLCTASCWWGHWIGNGKPSFWLSCEHICAVPQSQGWVLAPSKPHQLRAAKQKEWQADRNEPEGGSRRGILPWACMLQRGMGMPGSKGFLQTPRARRKALFCVSLHGVIKLPSTHFYWLWPTLPLWHSSTAAWVQFLTDVPIMCCTLGFQDGFVAAEGRGDKQGSVRSR